MAGIHWIVVVVVVAAAGTCSLVAPIAFHLAHNIVEDSSLASVVPPASAVVAAVAAVDFAMGTVGSVSWLCCMFLGIELASASAFA